MVVTMSWNPSGRFLPTQSPRLTLAGAWRLIAAAGGVLIFNECGLRVEFPVRAEETRGTDSLPTVAPDPPVENCKVGNTG